MLIKFASVVNNMKGTNGIVVTITDENMVISGEEQSTDLTALEQRIADLEQRIADLEERLENATASANLTLDCSEDPPAITGTIDINI
jgi:cell division protein FtsB